ncbi:MAG: hypothetical protein GXP39_01590 [Chloroflexi bacterium]|nr:hypothetical protein [Chloroflexota bacterium]
MANDGNGTATRKLAIICSKGTLDMAYPGLVLANAARMLGIEAMIFFTFWGMDIIHKEKVDRLKVTPVGNPSMGMPMLLGALPGMTDMATMMMRKKIDELDLPPVREFLEMLHDAGAKLYGCRMAADMMGLTKDDLVPWVEDIVGAMEFLEMAEGAQIIFV